MRSPLEWWRGRKWVYLGQTALDLTTTWKSTGTSDSTEVIVHFYAWQNNMKLRKFSYSHPDIKGFKGSQWFHKNMIPWLEGGDMWKPIVRPIAVQGNLVNFYKGGQP